MFKCCLYRGLVNPFSYTKGAFVWEYSEIRMYSGIYAGYSAPGSRIARMESGYSGMRIAPKHTHAYLHYSNYSYSGLIPNECALSQFAGRPLKLKTERNKDHH